MVVVPYAVVPPKRIRKSTTRTGPADSWDSPPQYSRKLNL